MDISTLIEKKQQRMSEWIFKKKKNIHLHAAYKRLTLDRYRMKVKGN